MHIASVYLIFSLMTSSGGVHQAPELSDWPEKILKGFTDRSVPHENKITGVAKPVPTISTCLNEVESHGRTCVATLLKSAP